MGGLVGRVHLAALLGACFVMLVAAPAATASEGCASASASAHEDGAGPTEAAVLCLVNLERARRGLKPLAPSRRLRASARDHSLDMVGRRYFDHVSPGGTTMSDRARRHGYIRRGVRWTLAENIGWGSGSFSTAAELVRAWMDSPPHRRNILSRVMRQVGVGIADGTPEGEGGTTGTLVFGRRG